MRREVTTWFLEMSDPGQFRPAAVDLPGVSYARAEIASPELNRFLYSAVGPAWYWVDRLPWTRDEWLKYLENVETWIAYERGTPAGYLELERRDAGEVEVAMFGLLPEFIGRRIGGALLSVGVSRAWMIDGTTRVTLHTCSLDSEHALANYTARGFRTYGTKVLEKELPDEPPEPWPGAGGSP